MIKYVYEIDYPFGEKRKYLEWIRSIADTLRAPGELRRLASYDNVFSATPHRVVEFTFDSLEDAARISARRRSASSSRANCRRTAPTLASRCWHPPPGFITHIRLGRVSGVGPWAAQH